MLSGVWTLTKMSLPFVTICTEERRGEEKRGEERRGRRKREGRNGGRKEGRVGETKQKIHKKNEGRVKIR